ncbi:hypothetical protein BCV72DRAFT_246127 [Rhizopus microsporus var. microsporus]|uniref:Uncharacterized protein n=1 Tax=Rhizopus microsporus var. microsporus TaxID=86635 RepID=A0A1X0QN83_RHIZD|nr:hypothetical protein BCV72DRAFT_246127 [Rhizopus microsporus var. microsporus]
MYQDSRLEREAEGVLLQVNGLPKYYDENKLYDTFRPFGPLDLCKCVPDDDGLYKGTAYIRYFYQHNSDNAQKRLDGYVIDGYKISVTQCMFLKAHSTSPYQKDEIMEDTNGSPVIDKMNLYVKNLDPKINNQELNQLFRKYGKIISARVMTNPTTGQSKGYGFVSFSKPEEAEAAKDKMNGFIVGGRALTVAYHEPKKTRANNNNNNMNNHNNNYQQPQQYQQHQQYQQQQLPLQQSQQYQQQQQERSYRPSFVCQPPSYFEPQQSYRSSMNGLGIDHMDELGINMNVRDLSIGQKPMYRKPSEQYSPLTTSTVKSLASLASGASIQRTPSNYIQLPPKRPTLRRKGSLESVMTESSANIQRARLETAVSSCGDYGEHIGDIVDMLLTLKRKERSLCLFNPDFLKEKISLALEALEACQESEESEDEMVMDAAEDEFQSLKKNRAPISPVYTTAYQPMSPPSQPKSKAIPIVAPPSASSASSSTSHQQPMTNKDTNEEIQALITSFEGKPIHEKKQLLGDKLFPLVKATGTKQAPKVTIRLLDTVDLHELARIMFDTPLLKSRVEEAFNSL